MQPLLILAPLLLLSAAQFLALEALDAWAERRIAKSRAVYADDMGSGTTFTLP